MIDCLFSIPSFTHNSTLLHLSPPSTPTMAVANPYNDLQPVRRIDEAEARARSNRIDEELKVRPPLPPSSAHFIGSVSLTCTTRRRRGNRFGRGRARRRTLKVRSDHLAFACLLCAAFGTECRGCGERQFRCFTSATSTMSRHESW